MSLTDQIAQLDKDLRDLIVSWERFFAGDLRVPPHNDHSRFSNRLRALSGKPNRRRADQFRLEQLQHRFTSYAANWERMLREREEGRGRFGGPAAAVPVPRAAANGGGHGSVDSSGKRFRWIVRDSSNSWPRSGTNCRRGSGGTFTSR
jgi:hypothetical protein